MPLKSYAVLKGRAKAKTASQQHHPHYHIWIEAAGRDYRVAVNVLSVIKPPEMQYLLKFRFQHPITRELSLLAPGLHPVKRRSGGLAVDYIRLNVLQQEQFLSLPSSEPGYGGGLTEVMDGVAGAAIADPDCWVYAFGEPWEAEGSDRIFRFFPSRGIHEVHMNQGNDPCHWGQDGTWQDGAILFEHPRQARWTGLFLKFQSQTWRTDDVTGHALFDRQELQPEAQWSYRPEGIVRIVAAMVCPLNDEGRCILGRESVTLLNVCPVPVDLTGWTLQNRAHDKWRLHGELAPGEAREIPLGTALPLGKEGGIITLLNREGLKIHGVYFTAEQADREGWRIAF